MRNLSFYGLFGSGIWAILRRGFLWDLIFGGKININVFFIGAGAVFG